MITESEYRLATGCPKKVLHSRGNLPRSDTDNAFAKWLWAESGKVRALARHLFPEAVEPARADITIMAEETRQLLAAGRRVAGAVFATGTVTCRVDVAESDGDTIRLYSVVSKAFDLERHRHGLEFTSQSGRLRKEWREHLELVAFRVWTVRQLHPGRRVIPLIVVPLAGAVCRLEGLHRCFEETDAGWTVVDPAAIAEAGQLLRIISVVQEGGPLALQVPDRVAALSTFLQNPVQPQIGYRCKRCEFNVEGKPSGIDRCMGRLAPAQVKSHVFNLSYCYFVQDEDGRPIADRLAREGRVSLWDIPVDRIVGEYAPRQRMQLEGTATGREIIRPELRDDLAKVEYPLHFLDIETIRTLLPVHAGTKANGLGIFQFSVHRRARPGADLEHIEWLHEKRGDPNASFLKALRTALGEEGSVLVWTGYEENSFREAWAEFVSAGEMDEALQWLGRLLTGSRLVDLHTACFAHYWHPHHMVGRTSIKKVLPAVWSEPSPVKARAPYAEFPWNQDPYAVLQAKGHVSDGVAAMEAYLAMQSAAGSERSNLAAQLRRYCGVDTLAMAFIYDYWSWRLDNAFGNAL